MNRKHRFNSQSSLRLLMCCALAALVVSQLNSQSFLAAEKPNIVIILVDDMGFSDIGCYGGEIETPNIDSLSEEGLRFTQFYNCGRCCPTRASLLTGLHPHQVGIGHMTAPPEQPLGFEGAYQGYLNNRCTTLAEVLGSSGYHTFLSGKWHLGSNRADTSPLKRGFDHYYGGLTGAFNYMKPGDGRVITRDGKVIETPHDWYATDALTDEAINYISDAAKADDDEPFFLYLAYNAPHWPLQPKLDDFKKYRGKYKQGWQSQMDSRLAKQKQIGLFPDDIKPAPHVGPKWESLSEKQRDDLDQIQASYAGCIDSIDQNVGKLVDHLKSVGQFENTIIFFLSDNGACQEGGVLGRFEQDWVENPPLATVEGIRQGLAWANASNTPFRLYKHFVHEGGACTPMIAHWPAGISKAQNGSFVRQFGYLPDFMATCLELSGAKYPADVPQCVGESLLPLLKGNREQVHVEPIYWEHEGNAAMRWDNVKLVKEYEKPWELYDIAADRTEMHNLADSNVAKRDEMIAMWEAWATKHQVAFPERFNMYQFLNKRKKQQDQKAKQSSKK